MKLEEGMYVRTKQGTIEKVIKRYDTPSGCKVEVNEDFRFKHYEHNYIKHIKNASHNIIDLIEAGDIIEVNEFKGNYEVKQFGLELSIIKDEYIYNLNSLHCKLNIKSIVTKQQFESMKYEVKKDE